MIIADNLPSYQPIVQAGNLPIDIAAAFDPEQGGSNNGPTYYDGPKHTHAPVSQAADDGYSHTPLVSTVSGGSIMRQHVPRAIALTPAPEVGPAEPLPMLRRRAEAYEGMMQIF